MGEHVISTGTVFEHRASIVVNSSEDEPTFAQLGTVWDWDDMNEDDYRIHLGVFVDLTRESIDELINELVRVQALLP